jgi:hypothetical protein
MNAKDIAEATSDGEVTAEHKALSHLTLGHAAPGESKAKVLSGKLLESCVAARSSLSQLLAGNGNTADVDAALRSSLRPGAGVVGAQIGNLLEYVELYCLAAIRGAFRVRSREGYQGTLWFDGGQLVHAQVDGQMGEDAALQILSWTSGTLQPSSTPMPAYPSIDVPWESLILKAEAWHDAE